MPLLLADTFTAALARLTNAEQKQVKMAAFDLQLDPSAPGLRLHRLEKGREANFWSARVNDDIRIILHKAGETTTLVHVDHHDAAYDWARRRRFEAHPATGAMQIVEVRELVELVHAAPTAATTAAPAASASATRPAGPPLFDNLRKFEVLALGVPEDWVDDVRAATEDTLFDILPHLPQEAQEALLRLAVGEEPAAPAAAPAAPVTDATADPFAHPDARRRFRIMDNREALERALDQPWERWAVFLHPAQEALVARDFGGPARVGGSAGTGKTIVALHRAVHLARSDAAARVLLTTFSRPLAHALRTRLAILVAGEPDLAARITVKPLNQAAHDLYTARFGQPTLASAAQVSHLIAAALAERPDAGLSRAFVEAEWAEVVDAWQLDSWEAYRDVPRLGRKTRIGGRQREVLWALFEQVRAGLAARKLVTWAGLYGRLATDIAAGWRPGLTHAVVDEAQDLSVPQARFLAALGASSGDGNSLFFAGDLGQRIFQTPFSWKALGIDVRGRSHTLKINYRTSHQIRQCADRLLPPTVADVDGIESGRRGTVSLFDGPRPDVQLFDAEADETAGVADWIRDRLAQGLAPDQIALVVRSQAEVRRARAAAKAAGLAFTELGDDGEGVPGTVAIATMHAAKGLEFPAVAVMACDDGVLPLDERINAIADGADLEEVYATERHLLYVACTRARDHLLVSGTGMGSEFLADLG